MHPGTVSWISQLTSAAHGKRLNNQVKRLISTGSQRLEEQENSVLNLVRQHFHTTPPPGNGIRVMK